MWREGGCVWIGRRWRVCEEGGVERREMWEVCGGEGGCFWIGGMEGM